MPTFYVAKVVRYYVDVAKVYTLWYSYNYELRNPGDTELRFNDLREWRQ